MKQVILNRIFSREREFQPVNRGLFRGCEMYLSMRDQFHICYGTHEREMAPHFERMAHSCGSFVDVGSGEGYYSVYMIRNTEAQVFAFEPNGAARAMLMNNLARNGDSEGRSMVSHRSPGDSPDGMTLDSIAGRMNEPVLLNINEVECPLAVLRGAKKILQMEDTRVIVEVHDAAVESSCKVLLKEAGYEVDVVGNAWWRSMIREGRKSDHVAWLVGEKLTPLAS